MKVYVAIALLFVVSANKAFCQLNKSINEILSMAAKDTKLVFDGKGISNDGYDYYGFKCKNGKVLSKTFYFKNDSCVCIRENLKNDQFSNVINEFNKKYKNMGNNIWIDRPNKIMYILDLVDNSPLFSILTWPAK